MTEDSGKDFFISYNQADRAWAVWIAWQLEAAGYTTIVQAWDFRPGSNFALEMQRAASTAKRTLAVLSPDYLTSLYAQPEWAAAFTQDPTGQHGTLLPVRVRPCELTGLLSAIVYVDLVDLDESTASKALFAGVQRIRAKPSSAPRFPGTFTGPHPSLPPRFPGSLPPLWNVPFGRNPFFTGRDTLLSRLHKQLHTTQVSALTQTQAISGLGGVGKTATAVEYAYRYRDEYEAVLWASAETRLSLLSEFVKLATLLQLPEKDAQEQDQAVAAVKRWLETHTGWLLILDNADDVQIVRDVLPQGGTGHILLTTRAQAVGTLARSIDVETMDQKEGSLLLLRRAWLLTAEAPLESIASPTRTTAEAIVEALGGLPLALDQAGAYIEETGCALADYNTLYQARRRDLLGMRKSLAAEHPAPVTTTWSLSFQQVEEASRAAAALLRLCAFLAPDAIPEELLTEGAQELGSVLEPVAADPLKLNGAIEVARRYSLLKRHTGTKSLSIHRLVQAVLRDEMSPKAQRQWAERVVRALNRVFPEVKMETWAQYARYLSQVQVCAQLIDQYKLYSAEAEHVLHQTGVYLQEHARYQEAEQFYQQALAIGQKALPADHPSTAATLHELGRLSQAQGKYEQAEQSYQQALAIEQKVLPADHPNTAITLESYASLLRQMHREKEAALLEARVKRR